MSRNAKQRRRRERRQQQARERAQERAPYERYHRLREMLDRDGQQRLVRELREAREQQGESLLHLLAAADLALAAAQDATAGHLTMLQAAVQQARRDVDAAIRELAIAHTYGDDEESAGRDFAGPLLN